VNLSCSSSHSTTVICDSTAGRGAAIIPLFDSSRQELSNGCHVVFLSNFDHIVEIPAAALILALPAAF